MALVFTTDLVGRMLHNQSSYPQQWECSVSRLVRDRSFQSDSRVEGSGHRWKIFATELQSKSVEVGRSCRSWRWSSFFNVQLVHRLKIGVLRSDPRAENSDRCRNFFLIELPDFCRSRVKPSESAVVLTPIQQAQSCY